MSKKAYNNSTVGEISGRYWGLVKKNARKRSIEFNITKEEAWEIFLKQNKRCIYTGLKITHSRYLCRKNGKDIYYLGTASIDRKDSSLGYVKGNIQWVHKDVNALKSNFKEKYFLKLCKLIVRRLLCH